MWYVMDIYIYYSLVFNALVCGVPWRMLPE